MATLQFTYTPGPDSLTYFKKSVGLSSVMGKVLPALIYMF